MEVEAYRHILRSYADLKWCLSHIKRCYEMADMINKNIEIVVIYKENKRGVLQEANQEHIS